jgi:hypothetical protein
MLINFIARNLITRSVYTQAGNYGFMKLDKDNNSLRKRIP